MEKKKYPTTPVLKRMHNLLTELEEAKIIVSKPYGAFWNRKVNVEALLEVTKEFAKARSNFWAEAVKVYPDLEGKNASSDAHEIIIT